MVDQSILLTLTLATSPTAVASPTQPFDPVSTEVSQDDDGTIEVIAFDADGSMVGAMLVSADAGPRLDASFADGYASVLVASVDHNLPLAPPRPGMLGRDQLQRQCGGEPEPGPESVTTWWETDLADPCDAPERIGLMLALARGPLLELGMDPEAHKPSRRECIWRFSLAGSLCAATIALPALAGGCAYNIIVNLCACAQQLGVKNFCDWD